MSHWRVTFHYPKRIGNVTWYGIVAASRLEAIAEAKRDAQEDDNGSLYRERGQPVKITARIVDFGPGPIDMTCGYSFEGTEDECVA